MTITVPTEKGETMATCKDCFHHEVCAFALFGRKECVEATNAENDCLFFVGDAAPVVRCKDCKHGELDESERDNYYLCHRHGCDWNDGNHFCSYGERRNNE